MKGLDIGTGNFVLSDDSGVYLQRNAFLTLDKGTASLRQLKVLKVPYIEVDNRIHIVGQKAYEYAQVFNTTDLRRPMSNGLLNPSEQDALPVLKVIIEELVKQSGNAKSGEKIVYSIPGHPLDQDREIDYHVDVLAQIIQSLGFKTKSLNEGVALGTAGLVDHQLTGIAISMGAGMMNVAIMYAGMSALQFSVAKGGDWIDKQVSIETGLSKAQVQFIKESGDYTIDPNSKDERSRAQQAIKTYYESLIRYLLANIENQFTSNSMPAFPNAVPIVVGGGTAMVNGFLGVFKEQFTQKEFPLNISEIIIADEPLTAVARGCYLDAQLEEV